MVAKVTERGLTIPKSLLPSVHEVEVRREGNLLIIIPIGIEDPLQVLGESPVACGAADASELHDRYL